MATFFALSVTAFPKDPQSGNTAWHLGHVSAYISGYSAAPLTMLLTWACSRNLERVIDPLRHCRILHQLVYCAVALVHWQGVTSLVALLPQVPVSIVVHFPGSWQDIAEGRADRASFVLCMAPPPPPPLGCRIRPWEFLPWRSLERGHQHEQLQQLAPSVFGRGQQLEPTRC
jgi:hypothetical protein